MLFTTLQFAVFFAVVYVLFFALRTPWRLWMLLAASYYFYMCSVPVYVAVILAITVIDYAAGIAIERAGTVRKRRFWLSVSIGSNFGLLFSFKYLPFLFHTFNEVLQLSGRGPAYPLLQFVLPIGISFHTFQAISYTVEVYRGRVPAERDFLRYALYVAFFPQMVAGPIERPYHLLPQFHAETRFSLDGFRSGLKMAFWGLFKKVCIADLLAPAVNAVYDHPQRFSGQILGLATFFFAIQIYCDFSGYSDMALGLARMMGYDLVLNFRRPYFAQSVSEFWHRWHISLSTWFRDYLYIPLGGSRVSRWRWYANLFVVFVLSGLWHGANWTFLIWGALHGTYIVAGHMTSGARERLIRAVGPGPGSRLLSAGRGITTFLLVTLAWVFFRALTVRDGIYVLSHLADWHPVVLDDLHALGLPRFEAALALFMIAVLFTVEWMMERPPESFLALWSRRAVRWSLYYAGILSVICFGVFGRVEFIYFQF